MPRVTLNGRGAVHVADSELLVGLTDLEIGMEGDNPVLYAAARGGGALSRFALGSGDGPASLQSSWDIPAGLLQLESSDIALVDGAGGVTGVMVAGLADDDLRGRVDTGGGLGGSMVYDAGAFDLGDISEIAMAPDGVSGLAALRGGGLVQLSFAGNGQVSVLAPAGLGALSSQRASAVAWIETGGTDYSVVTYGGSNDAALLQAGSNGRLSLVDIVGSTDGAWINRPGAVAILTAADGVSYAVVAASGSSSLTVLAIEGNSLRPVEHVVDSLDTRFDDADHLAIMEIAGQPFIVAAGSDRGLTVMSLLPGGQLLEVATIPASLETPLNGISALDAVVVGDMARIFVATQWAPYLVEFEFALGNAGLTLAGNAGADRLTGTGGDDMIVGAAGNDTMSGGAGDDVISDGAGADILTGGAGADIFVLGADGQIDRINDYQPGTDRIELQGPQPGLGADDIRVVSRSWGAELHIGDEMVRVYSASGASLSLSDFAGGAVGMTASISTRLSDYPDDSPDFGPETGSALAPTLRYQRPSFDFPQLPEPYVAVNPASAQMGGHGHDVLRGAQTASQISGGGGNDRIVGYNGADILTGAAGFDTIIGHGGNDTISGGGNADEIEGRAGDDVITGGDGYDYLRGDAGNDSMWGGRGPDRIWGGDGDDWIDAGFNYGTSVDGVEGGAGNDTIFGGVGFDLLIGGTGADAIDGGLNADNIFGEDGADMLYGNDGFDRLFGGAGDDQLYGGDGPDTHFGQGDNDRMWGGAGNDRFFGGTGSDFIVGEDGNDTLGGNAGFDTLIGGAGDDLLYGDFNADRFVFDTGHGHDTVVGFDALNALEVLDFSDLNMFSATSDVMAQAALVGNNVVIATGVDSSITLIGVSYGDLDGTDFLF
ncbi:Bifunctional hemolysin/adenylate cyclase precursor [Roseovarius sp. THAF9]|uniref:calcium-binding protein n=1 Tax=Roseovarius sp. THAF9 TaxID=2587847 RepID=UPI001269834C|nr:calcium-binding protein [Roseovarius sp. THAF9]QFT94722.1 Bifunctional hemolysin/adenylate cyclase precursor [Roseovarius sp. THAF9]